jgi:hypothetical protein
MADEYVLAKSMDETINQTEFNVNTRQFVWVNDSNSGSYSSGQISFDLTSIANSNRYVDWKSSYIAIPHIMSIQDQAGGAILQGTKEAQFALSFKNNVMNAINSLSLTLNNNQIIDVQSFSNFLINYKMLSSWSTTDEENLGDSIFFHPDTAQSTTWNGIAGASTNGIGLSNNSIAGSAGSNFMTFSPAGGLQLPQNVGRARRMLTTSFAIDRDMNAVGTVNGAGTNFLVSQTALNTIGKYCVIQNTTSAITYAGIIKIPMRFLHSYFDNAPLAKNTYYRMMINTHLQSSCAITFASTTANVTAYTPTTNFGIFPIQVSPLSPTTGTGLVVGTTGKTLLVRSAIGNSLPTVAGVAITASSAITSCRLYASLVEFTPLYEQIYLKNPTRQVEYFDYLSFNNIQNIASGGTYTSILTPSLAKLRKMYIFPIMNTTANGGFQPCNSPFASEPSTNSPYAFLTNLQVALSGVPIYNEPKQYSFMNFLEESRGGNSINGGLLSGLSSGLLSEHMYNVTYGTVVVDLSRKSPEQDAVGKSVQLSFTNSANYAMDYYVIIEYAKVLTMSVETGTLQV